MKIKFPLTTTLMVVEGLGLSALCGPMAPFVAIAVFIVMAIEGARFSVITEAGALVMGLVTFGLPALIFVLVLHGACLVADATILKQ